MTGTEESLAGFLESADWRASQTRLEIVPAGTSISVPTCTHSLTYVVAGGISTLDAKTRAAIRLDGHDRDFAEGDFIFSTGETPIALAATVDTRLVVMLITPAPTFVGAPLLPQTLTVRDFVTIEPGVAALVRGMGSDCPYPQAGDSIVCARIATIVMSTAIRAWVLRGCAPEHWLIKTQDPFIARALDAIHSDPSAPWSVSTLAQAAAMGRSAFAERFRVLIGVSPLAYVTSVRISTAQRHLGDAKKSIAEVAGLLGYASEDGFSRAFRRHTGQTPTLWRESAPFVAS